MASAPRDEVVARRGTAVERPTRVDILFGLAYDPDVRVRRTATALADAGYDVRILAWDRTGDRPRQERDGGVRVERARVRSRDERGWVQLLFLARVSPHWARSLRRDPPDVLHAVDLPVLLVALLLRPLLPRGTRLVYDAFEIYALMEAHKYPGWLLALIGWAERRLPRLADVVITPGPARARYFAERGVESVVVGNWIDPAPPTPSRSESRGRLGLPVDRFCLAYAGGLEMSRDIGLLVDHAAREPSDLVVVAGRGSQEELCRRAARELPNFRFLGWLPDPTPIYRAADALFYSLRTDHPYARYPAPNTLYSAIAHAVPLVYREQGELAEIAREATIGVPFRDGSELGLAVARLRDAEVRNDIAASLRSLQGRYNWQRAREALLAAYPVGPTRRTDAGAVS